MPATEDQVRELFEEIYLKEPWKLNPDIFRNNPDAVTDAVRHVCEACRFGTGPKSNLQIAPLINVRVKKSDLASLEEGAIPPSSPVTGEGIWEAVFGKPEGTAGWTWSELTEGVKHDLSLGIPTRDHDGRGDQAALGAVSFDCDPHLDCGVEGRNDIYRIGLRRVSEYEQSILSSPLF